VRAASTVLWRGCRSIWKRCSRRVRGSLVCKGLRRLELWSTLASTARSQARSALQECPVLNNNTVCCSGTITYSFRVHEIKSYHSEILASLSRCPSTHTIACVSVNPLKTSTSLPHTSLLSPSISFHAHYFLTTKQTYSSPSKTPQNTTKPTYQGHPPPTTPPKH
jgi:hypothetical protein